MISSVPISVCELAPGMNKVKASHHLAGAQITLPYIHSMAVSCGLWPYANSTRIISQRFKQNYHNFISFFKCTDYIQ